MPRGVMRGAIEHFVSSDDNETGDSRHGHANLKEPVPTDFARVGARDGGGPGGEQEKSLGHQNHKLEKESVYSESFRIYKTYRQSH